MSRRSGTSAKLLAALLGAAVLASAAAPADAQPFQRQRYEEWRYESKRPLRGYEGFPAPGVYCSYRREPNRVCEYDKRGREVCRIKSWTLVQSCS